MAVKINIKSTEVYLHAWYLHLKKGERFDQEYWNPAEGIREHNEEEAIGYSHIFVQAITQICGIDAGLVNGVEHTRVAEDDD